MKLSLQSENGDSVLLNLEGRVSQRDVELSDPIVETLGENAYSRNILVDMSEVASLDSSGVNWLLTSQKRMREEGGQLVLHSLSPIAMNVLKVLNLHTLLKLADTESAALRLVGGDA
jgi:anti-anti-sigma factor